MNRKISRPGFPPYTINNAVDQLLKDEFDTHRTAGTAHELIKKNKIDAIPFNHPNMNRWRHNFTGVQVEHEATGFLVYGAVDDIWQKPDEELIVVDYKATGASEYKIYESYKRQMEIYQWLLEQNGFKVSKRGYFLFAKVDKEKGFTQGKLTFSLFIEPYDGERNWVESAIVKAKECLEGVMPEPKEDCEYCKYHLDRVESQRD